MVVLQETERSRDPEAMHDVAKIGKWLVEAMKPAKFEALKNDIVRESFLREDTEFNKAAYDKTFSESATFKEAENTMANSTSLYTKVLAKRVYYKSYEMYKQYYDSILQLTPADLGMPEGAGSYQIPKIYGSVAVKISAGVVTDYDNDGKDEVTMSTDSYAIGTRITRRLIKRGARGFIQKFMQAGSDAVHIAFSSDIANSLASGVDESAAVSTAGVSYDSIELAKKYLKTVKNPKGRPFGFRPNTIAFSATGLYTFLTSTDVKSIISYSQRKFMVGNAESENQFTYWNGMRVLEADLMTATIDNKDVHCVIYDKNYYLAFLMETGMDTYMGRLPGTAGNEEIIQAFDAGIVVMNQEAAYAITASA